MRWSLIPIWAKDAKIGSAMINARAEGVATKPAFRGARLEFKLPLARHYLILALGRYGMRSVGFAPGSRRRRAGAAMCRRAWSSSRHAASSDGRALFDCRTAFLLLLVSVLAGHAPTALGQRLSGKPVTLVVGSAAGGGIDIIARLLAVRLAESLVHAVIVENRPGAAARIANEHVAKAAPDGLTLLVTTAVGAIDLAGPVGQRLDPLHDFAPVSTIASSPMVLVVNPSVPVMTVRELIDRARTMPGSLNCSSSGSGTTGHLYAELFKLRTGTDIVHVPFKGTAPALSALLAGVVDMSFVPVPGVVQYVKTGRLRPLATTGATRSALLPEVPTMTEAGAGGVEASVWYGVLAPAATPRDIVNVIALAINDATHSAEFRQRLLELGAEPVAMTPDQFGQLLRDQMSQWTEVVGVAGIRGD